MNTPTAEQKMKTQGAADNSPRWLQAAAGLGLLAGGVLLLNGRRRAGTVVGTSGAVLALAGQQAELKKLWKQLPAAVDGAEEILSSVQRGISNLETRRLQLHELLGRKE